MTQYKLGRIVVPDARDNDFRMDRKLGLVPPSPTGARLWGIPNIYDQGSSESCTGFSSSAALSALFYAGHKDDVVFDALGLYTWANANDGDPTPHEGSTVRAALQGLVAIGDDIISSTGPGDVAKTFEKLNNYVWADTSAPQADLPTLTQWLLTVSPVVIGIGWTNDMFCQDPATGTFVAPPGGFIPITGASAGGHAICVRGVNANDPANVYFVLRNSWGPSWGITVHDDWTLDMAHGGGDILIRAADLVTLLSQEGEAGALVDNLTPITPTPTPAPA